MYRNKSTIADDVMPRVTVNKQAFKYFKHTLADGFTIPDTKVARASAPNRVEFTATETTDQTVDYALDDSIPFEDIENSSPGMNPQGKATEYISNLIALDREVRVATAAFTAGNYAGGNQSTLSGTSQWSDFTNSDPISAILTAMDSMVMRPNVMVLGQAVWTKLSTHPKLVKAFYGTSADTGIVTREFIRQLFELDGLFVGQSWYNTARKGQTATLARAWGKHCSLIYRDNLASVDRGTTWGLTAQYGSRVAGSFEDRDVGMRGGVRVRAGESVKEVITANDLGYLFVNAVA
ncbi:MAG: major capsid protein [Betaproteobacteria bacterium]|nr:major capsid protein [Betaproteobacteria bacterium]